jgi:hypothetical protein
MDVRSTIFLLSAPFSDMLLTHSAIIMRLYQLVVNFNGEGVAPVKTVSHYELLRGTIFPVSLPLLMNLELTP